MPFQAIFLLILKTECRLSLGSNEMQWYSDECERSLTASVVCKKLLLYIPNQFFSLWPDPAGDRTPNRYIFLSVIGFNVVYQQFRAMYDSGCQICFNWCRLKPGFQCANTPKYHAADKHDTPPSHIKLTLGQPALSDICLQNQYKR